MPEGSLSLSLRGVNDHDVVSRTRPAKPAIDPEHEKRLKLEEEKRPKLEEELRQLKEIAGQESRRQPPAGTAQTAADRHDLSRHPQRRSASVPIRPPSPSSRSARAARVPRRHGQPGAGRFGAGPRSPRPVARRSPDRTLDAIR